MATLNAGRVVLVPGFMGSRLARRADGQLIWVDALWAPFHLAELYDELLLRAPDDPRLGPDGALDTVPFGEVVHFGVYSPLRRFATSPLGLGLLPSDFVEHAYDWRKGLDGAAADLEALLAGLPDDGKPVAVIAHSQGGLVVSRLLSLGGPGAARVTKLFAVGCPFSGLLKTIDVMERDAGLLIGALAGHPMRSLLSGMPGAYELMPSGHVPSLFRGAAGDPTTPFEQAAALPPYYDRDLLAAAGEVVSGLAPSFSIPLRLVEGYGVETPVAARLVADGVEVVHGLEGDGTCPSASLLAASTSSPDRKVLSVPFGDHIPLVAHPTFLAFLREDLVPGMPPRPQVVAKVAARMAPAGAHDVLLVQARDASGAALGEGPPRAVTGEGVELQFSAFGTRGGAWQARFAHPAVPGLVRISIPGVASELQPRPILLG